MRTTPTDDIQALYEQLKQCTLTNMRLQETADAAIDTAILLNRDLKEKRAWAAAWKAKAKQQRDFIDVLEIVNDSLRHSVELFLDSFSRKDADD